MDSYLVVILLPLILVLFFHSRNTKNHTPPGPPRLPLIGNLHQFDARFPHTYLHRLSKQYGPIISLKLGFRPVVVISSAHLVREIAKSHDAIFSGRPNLVSQRKLSYNGLDVAFSPYNEAWRELRKICSIHLFSAKQVQSFRLIFKDEVSMMVRKIAMDAASSMVTDLSEMMVSFSNNSICRVALGKSYGDEGYGKRNRFFDLLHDSQAIYGGLFVGDYLPPLRWIDSLSGMAAKLEKNFQELDLLYEEVIEEHLNPNRPKSMEGDVVDILLHLNKNGSSSSSLHLTLDHIKAIIMISDITAGGTDAVAAVIEWGLTALMKNPSIMEKVQGEIRQLAAVKKDLIEEEDVAKLPYLRAVIKETFRLYPPSPVLIPRETTQKCSLNGYEIESGTTVYINAWAIGRDPKIWENADEFVPERFLESEVDVRGQNPEVIPFGIGRGGCPGIGIAMVEVELALANLLYKFDWELPPGMKEDDIDFHVLPGVTMHKKNALCLVAKVVKF